MRLKSNFLTVIALGLLCLGATAQSTKKTWTLQECISYAVDNNISVRQSILRVRDGELDQSTARNTRLPSLNASMGGNMNFGRGAGRDGVMEDRTSLSTSAGLSASMPVFTGFRIKNNIESSKLNLQAALSDAERITEDISLNVTSFYLQVLFNRELLTVAQNQVEISKHLLKTNEIKFNAGKIPEATVVENRSQLARDEYNLVQQSNTYTLSILDLKQLLNLEESDDFTVALPSTNDLALDQISDADSIQQIYEFAVTSRPAIQADEYRYQASLTGIKIAKSQLYPQISLGAGYSNSYYYTYADGVTNSTLGNQLKNNGSEYIGLNVSIPIFNKLSTRNQIRSATLSASSQELALMQTKLTLRKEIEQAYYRARSAYHKYISSRESADASRKSFRYEEERLNAGVSTIYDYNLAKSSLQRAESEMIQAKYEFVFSTKILKFYKGEPLGFEY